MKFTIRDVAFAVAIVGLGLAFYIHIANTKLEIDAFKNSTKHELMSFEFENKFSTFVDSFHNSEHKCKTSNVNYSKFDTNGEYKFKCVLSRQDGQPMKGGELYGLLRPMTTGYRIDTEKHWTVDTSWELESSIATMERDSWEIGFVIEYSFNSTD